MKRLQPISIHGQLSYDVHYVFADDTEESVHVARVGPEAVAQGLQAGDRAKLDFLLGVVTAIHKSAEPREP